MHPGSMGLISLKIETMHGTAGYVFSVYPPEIDPTDFPTGPHYVMWWGSRDVDGTIIEEPHPENSSYYLGSALAKRATAIARGGLAGVYHIGRKEPSHARKAAA
ncbi:hypothetical protein GCM10025867_47460 (plasmid) [Frondihabitans sucicola]|uniref:Uncharacterized protein n=1 Tax=Frondihabitans sucicola TaxID=1268041 RepID=A0ABN6Y952_9MICO|nr:hypothetical protein GCM10025867_47460 [Frondihabitans sucicola]